MDHQLAHTSSIAPPANILSLLLLRKLASWKDAHISLSPANCTMPSVMGKELVRLCWLRPDLAGTPLFRGDMSSSRRSLLAGLGCCLVASFVPATRASAAARWFPAKADMSGMTFFVAKVLRLMKTKQQIAPLSFNASSSSSNVQGSDRMRSCTRVAEIETSSKGLCSNNDTLCF